MLKGQRPQPEAIQACANLKQHLPSIREWAEFAVSLGARGIIKKDEFEKLPREMQEKYEEVPDTSAGGATEVFYYSAEGYRSLPGDTGETEYWSSSAWLGCVVGGSPDDPTYHGNSIHTFFGNGEIHDRYYTLNLSVRCFEDQP